MRLVRPFTAIAAMSLNRVIGAGNKIPWHLPEDFQWFKKMTTGHVLIMGRKTYESIGKPLPNRMTIVLSRSANSIPGVQVVPELKRVDPNAAELAGKTLFICGGAEIYKQALPLCSDLYLTLVKRVVEGDRFFPSFEEQFELAGDVLDNAQFRISHYRQKPL